MNRQWSPPGTVKQESRGGAPIGQACMKGWQEAGRRGRRPAPAAVLTAAAWPSDLARARTCADARPLMRAPAASHSGSPAGCSPCCARQCSFRAVDESFLLNDVGLGMHNDMLLGIVEEVNDAIIKNIDDGTVEQ